MIGIWFVTLPCLLFFIGAFLVDSTLREVTLDKLRGKKIISPSAALKRARKREIRDFKNREALLLKKVNEALLRSVEGEGKRVLTINCWDVPINQLEEDLIRKRLEKAGYIICSFDLRSGGFSVNLYVQREN